jgi:hypothetical protein
MSNAEALQPKFTNTEMAIKLFSLRIKKDKVYVTALCSFDDILGVYAVFKLGKFERSLQLADHVGASNVRNYCRTRETEYGERYKFHEFNFPTREEFIEAAEKGQDLRSRDGKDDGIESHHHFNRNYIFRNLQLLMNTQPR